MLRALVHFKRQFARVYPVQSIIWALFEAFSRLYDLGRNNFADSGEKAFELPRRLRVAAAAAASACARQL